MNLSFWDENYPLCNNKGRPDSPYEFIFNFICRKPATDSPITYIKLPASPYTYQQGLGFVSPKSEFPLLSFLGGISNGVNDQRSNNVDRFDEENRSGFDFHWNSSFYSSNISDLVSGRQNSIWNVPFILSKLCCWVSEVKNGDFWKFY